MSLQSADPMAVATPCRVVPSGEQLFLTVQNAALMLDLSERTIQSLVSTRALRSTFVGGRRLIFVDSIRELVASGVG